MASAIHIFKDSVEGCDMTKKTTKLGSIPLSFFMLHDKTNVEKIVFGDEANRYGGHKHIDRKLSNSSN